MFYLQMFHVSYVEAWHKFITITTWLMYSLVPAMTYDGVLAVYYCIYWSKENHKLVHITHNLLQESCPTLWKLDKKAKSLLNIKYHITSYPCIFYRASFSHHKIIIIIFYKEKSSDSLTDWPIKVHTKSPICLSQFLH